MRRRRKLILAGFLFALLALGLWWASRDRGPRAYHTEGVETPCLEVLPGREHRARAGCTGVGSVGGHAAEMRFNRLGLRGPDYAPKPAKGVTRILLLGSSNILGLGVSEAVSVGPLLEAALRGRGHAVEVINGATVGYCALQTMLRARELVEAYSPGIVVYDLNQGSCPLFDGAWEKRLRFEDGYPVAIDRTPFPGGPSWLNHWIFGHPPVFFFWLSVADQWGKAAFARSAGGSPSEYLAPTVRALKKIEGVAARRGAVFLLATHHMPAFSQSVPRQLNAMVVRLLSPWIRDPGIGTEELLGGFRQAGFDVIGPLLVRRADFIPGDEHFGEAAHRVYADGLALELEGHLPSREETRRSRDRE